jgi:hypothetical protein
VITVNVGRILADPRHPASSASPRHHGNVISIARRFVLAFQVVLTGKDA